MPWIIGIDEAGYGPNLGPFVMSSVAVRVPDELAKASLWTVLAAAVRQAGDTADERLMVADSKLVYAPARGLVDLETSVLGVQRSQTDWSASSLADYIRLLCPAHESELLREPWYDGKTDLPVATTWTDCDSAARRLASVCAEQRVRLGPVKSVVVCPTRFNSLLDRWDSKGVVLSLALVDLLQTADCALDEDEPIQVFIDKHGGRNNYAPLLQNAFRDDLVLAYEEGREQSSYRVARARQPVTITVQPRADAAHFCVALASLYSKYLRELLMLEFNRFWQRHVPELKPTAGYPLDATRFFQAIQPALKRLEIPENVVWRRK